MKIVTFVVLVAIIGAIAWFLGISDVAKINAIKNDIIKDANVTLYGVRLVEKKFNKPSLQLIAAKSVAPLGEEKTTLERFTLVSYSDDSGEVTLTADSGVIMNDTKNLEAEGNIVVRDDKGQALITERLSWDQERRVITTDDVVRVFGTRFVLTGKGMIVHPDDETVEILSNVKVTFEP